VSSLHQRIHEELDAKIRSGEWPPGHRLPFESELMAQYGCARMTVNKVMSSLAASGRILRRRRAGSFVAPARAQAAVLQIPDMAADIAARGANYGYRLLSRRRVEKAGAAADFLAGGPVLSLRCLHLADGMPFALEQRMIGLGAVPDAAGMDFGATPPGTWLLANVPWSDAEHEIAAVNADAAAGALNLEAGAACLEVTRRTWRDGVPVTLARQLFPGAAYRLVARFSP
jgi:GntR family histidine utilization transcriptional repressor